MNLLAWNVRGLGGKEKRRLVKELLRLEWHDLVSLVETKKEIYSREFIKSLWNDRCVEWAGVGSLGASRGILLLWNSKCLSVVEVVWGPSPFKT